MFCYAKPQNWLGSQHEIGLTQCENIIKILWKFKSNCVEGVTDKRFPLCVTEERVETPITINNPNFASGVIIWQDVACYVVINMYLTQLTIKKKRHGSSCLTIVLCLPAFCQMPSKNSTKY